MTDYVFNRMYLFADNKTCENIREKHWDKMYGFDFVVGGKGTMFHKGEIFQNFSMWEFESSYVEAGEVCLILNEEYNIPIVLFFSDASNDENGWVYFEGGEYHREIFNSKVSIDDMENNYKSTKYNKFFNSGFFIGSFKDGVLIGREKYQGYIESNVPMIKDENEFDGW